MVCCGFVAILVLKVGIFVTHACLSRKLIMYVIHNAIFRDCVLYKQEPCVYRNRIFAFGSLVVISAKETHLKLWLPLNEV